jgi:hypothetical protein
VGRVALLAELDRLLIEERADRWVVMTGGPGMGKSALLAAWLARRTSGGDAVPHHFIRRGEYDWDDPIKLVGSLVAQIETRFPGVREPEGNVRMHPAARLDAMLTLVSQQELAPRGERLVVLIDGLDEYDPPPGTTALDPLAAFLPHALPRGVSALCASRPRDPYVDVLVARGAVQLDLNDKERFGEDNEATVRAFWEQAAPVLGLDERFIAAAVERADGNLQHAAMLRKQLDGVAPGQRRVEDIPRGLKALLARAWERIATDPAVVDGLGILCAAREALTLDELGAVSGWGGEAQRRGFLRGARELLLETRRAEGVAEYRLHHDSIRGQIAAAIGAAALRGHHRRLGQTLASWPAGAGATARRYALRHALAHRAEAGEWADAWRVASDLGSWRRSIASWVRRTPKPTWCARRSGAGRQAMRRTGNASRRWSVRWAANRTGCAWCRRRPRRWYGTSCGGRDGAPRSWGESCRFPRTRAFCACGTWPRARARPSSARSWATPTG